MKLTIVLAFSLLTFAYSFTALGTLQSGGQCCATSQDCLNGVCQLPTNGQNCGGPELPGTCVPIPDSVAR